MKGKDIIQQYYIQQSDYNIKHIERCIENLILLRSNNIGYNSFEGYPISYGLNNYIGE